MQFVLPHFSLAHGTFRLDPADPFAELNFSTHMTKKEYPMPADYNAAAQQLVDMIELRETVKKQMLIASPEGRAMLQPHLLELDEAIEASEAALAAEYEATQEKLRAEKELEKSVEVILETTAAAFIHVKHNHPEKLEDLRSVILKDLTPEEISDFYDRVKRLEATRLEEIIARKA